MCQIVFCSRLLPKPYSVVTLPDNQLDQYACLNLVLNISKSYSNLATDLTNFYVCKFIYAQYTSLSSHSKSLAHCHNRMRATHPSNLSLLVDANRIKRFLLSELNFKNEI